MNKNLLGVLSAATLYFLLPAPAAHAERPIPPENIKIKDGLTMPGVFDPWTEANIEARYKFGLGPWWMQGLNGVVNVVGWPWMSYLMDDFDNVAADKIAAGCKAKYPSDQMLQVRCSAEAVNIALQSVPYGPGGQGPGLRSYCRDHARAMQEVFGKLDIPQASMETVMMDGHIVNLLIYGSPEGQYYSYVLDAGWDPGKLWPYNDAAIRRADTNGDGKTDNSSIPPMGGFQMRFVAAPTLPPPSSSTIPNPTGNNAKRNDATVPVARPGTGASAAEWERYIGSGGGAGTAR